MNDQRSVTDQLQTLLTLANQNGLYDAADWVTARIESSRERSFKLHWRGNRTQIVTGCGSTQALALQDAMTKAGIGGSAVAVSLDYWEEI